jgi:hypothetical protein
VLELLLNGQLFMITPTGSRGTTEANRAVTHFAKNPSSFVIFAPFWRAKKAWMFSLIERN